MSGSIDISAQPLTTARSLGNQTLPNVSRLPSCNNATFQHRPQILCSAAGSFASSRVCCGQPRGKQRQPLQPQRTCEFGRLQGPQHKRTIIFVQARSYFAQATHHSNPPILKIRYAGSQGTTQTGGARTSSPAYDTCARLRADMKLARNCM